LAKFFVSATVAVVIIIVAIFAIYGSLTYPQTLFKTNVSFAVGTDSKTIIFNQPIYDDKTQVQVTIQNGAVLWRAQILNGTQIVWEHSAAQVEQQSFDSGWISLPSGNYTFTFGTVGVGSLDATATVSAKGGFW